MAEQGYILDIDTKFIERLEKADKALDKMVKSVDNVTDSLNGLASGPLSNFASLIDSITGSVGNLSKTKVGDLGLTETQDAASEAIDRINIISTEIDKITVNGKTYSNGSLVKLKEDTEEALRELEKVQEKLKFFHEGEGAKAIGFIDLTELESQADALIAKINQLQKKRLELFAGSAQSIQDMQEQEVIDRQWRAMEDDQKARLKAEAKTQNEIAKNNIQAREEEYDMYEALFDKVITEKNNALAKEYELEQKYEKDRVQRQQAHYEDLRKWRERQVAQEAKRDSRDNIYASEISQHQEARKQKEREDEAYAKFVDARKKEQEAAFIEAEKAMANYEREEIRKTEEAEKQKQQAIIDARREYKKVVEEINDLEKQSYRKDLFEAKNGVTFNTQAAAAEILQRQQELNKKRTDLEEEYQEHLTDIIEQEEASRAKRILDNAENQARVALEIHKRNEKNKKEADEKLAKSTHQQRTTFEGALEYSKETKTINEQIQAIRYLKEARDKLNKETLGNDEYKRQIKEINEEIKRQEESTRELRDEQDKLTEATHRLSGIMSTVFGIHAIRGYVDQVMRIRGEFELQKRSLEALLQNKSEANKLWTQTVQLAVKSPFQVKELVTYTKQLAAYRVETEKLHDTTKMLADISAGLGVDMGRLILAFGQVKAANYLRGTELRQFSEAGINILDELAQYYSQIEGQAVTVAEVFERVSKRMVTFTDVEMVLKKATSAGGMFYKMQEIQSETLKGSISNLKDQIDLMLDDIGKKNEGIMKGGVALASWLVKNYRFLIPVLSIASAGFISMQVAMIKASIAARTLTAGLTAMKTAMLSPWTLVIAALATVASLISRHIHNVKQINAEYNRLDEAIREVDSSFKYALDEKKVDRMKTKLHELNEVAKKDFNIDFGLDADAINNMDFTALENKFVELRNLLFDANAVAAELQKAFNKIRFPKGGLIGVFGKDTIANDLNVFEREAMKAFQQMRANRLSVYSKLMQELSEEEKAEFAKPLKELYEGQQPGESDFLYYTRLLDLYHKLEPAMRKLKLETVAYGQQVMNMNNAMHEAAASVVEIGDKLEGRTEEERTAMAKKAIDAVADSKQWSELQRYLVYKVANMVLPAVAIPLMEFDKDVEDQLVIDPNKGLDESQHSYWQDLIKTIKELHSSYKELNKTFDSTTAKEGAIIKYTDALNEALSHVLVNGKKLKAEDFLSLFDITSEKGMTEALDMISREAPKAADKLKAKLEKGEITWEVKIKTKEDEDKKLTNWIEDLFSGYELSIELEKLNVPRDLAKNIFNLDATTLGEVRSQLIGAKSQFTGEKQIAEYEKALRKIDELEDKAQQERLKKYVKYLVAGQGERVKIKLDEMRQIAEIESLPFDDAQKELAKEAVRAEANKRIEKLDWEEFKDSGMYVRLFEDLEFASSRTLKLMREKLIELKSQLGDLDADDLKHLYDQIEKLDNELVERNPYKALAESAGGYFKSLKRLKDAEAELVASQGKQANLDSRFSNVSAQLSEEKRIYEQMSKSGKASAKDLDTQREKVGALNSQLLSLKAQLAAQGKLTKELEAEIDALTKARKMFTGSAEEIGRDISEAANALPQVAGHLENVFGTMSDGTRDTLDSIATIGGGIGDAIAGFASNNPVQAIMGIAQAIGGIFAIGDKAKERKIQRELKHVEELDKRYQEIDEALDNMYNSRQMAAYTKELNDNIDSQIESYERMRALEEDKKKSDQAKIDEYNQSIEDLNKRREEMFAEQQSKATGGILDDALSAAEGFVDAWYDAFQETGDGLAGLENNFKEMLTNLIKKQAAMQIAGNFTKQYSNWLKEYIDVETGDTELTAEEARLWAERVQATFPELSNMLENFFSGTQDLLQEQSELSELSKGIQGVTESTAQVLEALLNSMRFYVADSNVQLKNIANALISNDVEANPLLNELRQQTAMIRSIENMFDSVIGRGDSIHSGAYLKVSM